MMPLAASVGQFPLERGQPRASNALSTKSRHHGDRAEGIDSSGAPQGYGIVPPCTYKMVYSIS